ncbi:hypothetical protein FRC07_011048 [Ceratobasidium sp. 392]|nr:hypothetical protein FRC07_011048 [Ceratobasidium sp. 392]
MEVYEPYLTYRQPEPGTCYSSDSEDLEPPQLSETPNETENDTPPETPLRSSILDDFSFAKYYGIKDPVVPPVHIAQPLVVANPHPVRPPLHSFRTFPITERQISQEKDGGYDSEREAPIRPSLPRFRSYRRSPEVMMRSSPLTTPKLGTSAGILWANDGSSPIAKRPRHPPPPETRDFGIQTDRTPFTALEELLADPNVDHAALWSRLVSTGIPFKAHKDRRNEVTGLGHGFPSSLAQDTSRIPTVVPKPRLPAGSENDPSRSWRPVDPFPAIGLEAPIISPVEFSDEDDMSPITLPASVLSPEDRLFLDFTQAGDYVEDLAAQVVDCAESE